MLKALFLNGTLKKSPEPSHTEALMRESMGIFEGAGFETEMVRFVDYPVAFGVDKDLGPGAVWGEADAWPHIFEKVMAAHAVIVGSPIWIGNPSSACIQL